MGVHSTLGHLCAKMLKIKKKREIERKGRCNVNVNAKLTTYNASTVNKQSHIILHCSFVDCFKEMLLFWPAKICL